MMQFMANLFVLYFFTLLLWMGNAVCRATER